MPQSLANLHIHLIFSTKERYPFLTDSVRPHLHAYMATVLVNLDSPALLINSVPDHAHILFDLARTIALAKIVEEVKKTSSKWLKQQSPDLGKFAWQNGYGAFSVSQSNLETVTAYIRNQTEHHRRVSLQDEYRAFLHKHRIAYDERYLWD